MAHDLDIEGWGGGVRTARLADAMLGGARPIVVIEAPAGTGKSRLLADLAQLVGGEVSSGPDTPLLGDGCAFWDVPTGSATVDLPDVPPDGNVRLVLAKRPEIKVAGLARARIYGRVTDIKTDALLFRAEEVIEALGVAPALARVVLSRCGGWACLLALAASDTSDADAGLVEFLRAELLKPLAEARLVALEALLDGRAADAALLSGLPFVDPDRPLPLHPVLATVETPLRQALAAEIHDRMGAPHAVRAIAKSRAALGQEPQAIAALQSIGAWQGALATLRRAGGPFFVHRFGVEAFDRMLAGFPDELSRSEELLALCRAIQVAKRGETALGRRILHDRWGAAMEDALAVVSDHERFSRQTRFFRFLLCTWEDFDLEQDHLDAAWRLLAELPADDQLLRGSFYNAVLEIYIRRRRFSEADHIAIRAAAHYARAGVPILSFYVDLHRGIIQLFLGAPRAARRFARSAGLHLGRTPFESPGDARLLALLEACIDFEEGRPQALGRFLSLEVDDMAQGEVWPSLIELVLVYGTQLLAEQYSLIAARGFLDRWRVTGERSRQFRLMIDISEVALLQGGNRWLEAAAMAARLPSRITRERTTEAGALSLATLTDRDEIALAIVWLRQIAHEAPRAPGLEAALRAMLDNPHLTARQRLAAELTLARILQRFEQVAAALAQVERAVLTSAHRGSLAILRGEREALADLTATKRIREPLWRNEAARRALRQMQDGGTSPARRAQGHGLTRQETRILHLLTEGAPNKSIAKMMALSEATVKFHLANLYRKLGCGTRREAAAAAAALGLAR